MSEMAPEIVAPATESQRLSIIDDIAHLRVILAEYVLKDKEQ